MSCEHSKKKGGILLPCMGEEFPSEYGLLACESHDPVRFRARHEEMFQPADGPRCYEGGKYKCHRPKGHDGWHMNRDGDVETGWRT